MDHGSVVGVDRDGVSLQVVQVAGDRGQVVGLLVVARVDCKGVLHLVGRLSVGESLQYLDEDGVLLGDGLDVGNGGQLATDPWTGRDDQVCVDALLNLLLGPGRQDANGTGHPDDEPDQQDDRCGCRGAASYAV